KRIWRGVSDPISSRSLVLTSRSSVGKVERLTTLTWGATSSIWSTRAWSIDAAPLFADRAAPRATTVGTCDSGRAIGSRGRHHEMLPLVQLHQQVGEKAHTGEGEGHTEDDHRVGAHPEVLVDEVVDQLPHTDQAGEDRKRTEESNRLVEQHPPHDLQQIAPGISQPVELGATGALRILDRHVIQRVAIEEERHAQEGGRGKTKTKKIKKDETHNHTER